MKFYSKITDKPNSIMEEVKDGFRVVSRKRICIFHDGVLETDDPVMIAKLEKRPDLFRTDRPWIDHNWRITEEGIELLAEGEKLGIDCRHIRKEYLMKLIQEKIGEVLPEVVNATPEPEKVEVKEVIEGVPNEAYKEAMKMEEEAPKPTIPVVKIDYKEIMRLAKEKGIKSHGVKKTALVRALKQKGVMINA